jgi:hypothetical protein
MIFDSRMCFMTARVVVDSGTGCKSPVHVQKSGKPTTWAIDDAENADTDGARIDHRAGGACMTHTPDARPVAAPPRETRMPDLETALRRAAVWARRGMRDPAALLLAGTDGRLRFRRDPGVLCADLPGGVEVRVALSTTNERVIITRLEGDHRIAASADLPVHLVDSAA